MSSFRNFFIRRLFRHECLSEVVQRVSKHNIWNIEFYFINMLFLTLGKNAPRPPVALSIFYDFLLNSIRSIILTNIKFE